MTIRYLTCMYACLGGSSDAARVRARAREMKGPRWPRYWRKRGRIEIARRLTKIENSKRSIISRARVATDCAGASTPNHVLRHAARPHARCGCFDVPNALGEGRAQDRADGAVGTNARASLGVLNTLKQPLTSNFYVWKGGGVSYDEREG